MRSNYFDCEMALILVLSIGMIVLLSVTSSATPENELP